VYLKTLYFLLTEGWKKQLLVQRAPRMPQGKEEDQLQADSLLSLSLAAPLPGLLPEGAARICLNMTVASARETDRSERCIAWVWLSQAPVWVCVRLLSSGMGYVEFPSLSYLLPGLEVLSLISRFSPGMARVLSAWGARQLLYWWALVRIETS